jgi:hypothetical protein
MRKALLAIACTAGLIAPAFAQKAEIDAVNAQWIEFFNKGDFAGVASLYTADAAAFPPGSAMVQGRAAIGKMWKGMAERPETYDARRQGSRPRPRDRDLHPDDQGGRRHAT